MWTDEKHSSYLKHLEVSFVKQLHQNLLAHCSNRYEGDKGIPQIHPINARDTSQQLADPVRGCWEKINCNRGDPLSHVLVELLRHTKCIGMKCPASARTLKPLTLCDTEDHPKFVKSRRSDSLDPVEEGTGQNFTDEDDEVNSITESRAKRLKTVLPE